MSLRELVEQKRNQQAAREVAQAAWSNSLPAKLGLNVRQTSRLDSLYNTFALRRMDQEAKIAGWQQELQQAQAPANFDQHKVSRLLKSIAGAQENIRDVFLQARGEALKVLTPQQRDQLQTMATGLATSTHSASNGVLPVRDDQYRQLLLMPVEQLLQTPIDIQTGRRLLAERARERNSYYDRGYYGGSPFGVYGRYGHRRSGFGIGIGRGFWGYWP
jgi:hypothetical protein